MKWKGKDHHTSLSSGHACVVAHELDQACTLTHMQISLCLCLFVCLSSPTHTDLWRAEGDPPVDKVIICVSFLGLIQRYTSDIVYLKPCAESISPGSMKDPV